MWTIQHTSQAINQETAQKINAAFAQLISEKPSGFFDFAILQKGAESARALADRLRADYDSVGVLGIGGSSLGAQAVIEALQPQALEDKKVVFFDNVDAKSFFRKIKSFGNLQRTLWVLISKSGGTVETLAQADYLEQYLWSEHQIHLHQKSVVITEFKSSPLHHWAEKHKVPQLEVPVSIGGRFSVLTPVGLFLFSLLNIDISQLLAGAQKAFSEQKNIIQLATQFAMSFERGEQTTYFLSYCDDLKYWGQWLQQLWAESLGKKTTQTKQMAPPMSVPYACRGATDQHSVLQQIAEGTQKKMVCLLRVAESENFGFTLKQQMLLNEDRLEGKNLGQLLAAEASAIQQALNEANVATVTLISEQLNPQSIGYLLMTFQMVVATLGLAFQIDPFNQPGVERGKVLTRLILSNSLKFS